MNEKAKALRTELRERVKQLYHVHSKGGLTAAECVKALDLDYAALLDVRPRITELTTERFDRYLEKTEQRRRVDFTVNGDVIPVFGAVYTKRQKYENTVEGQRVLFS